MSSLRRRLTGLLTVHLAVAVVIGGVAVWLWARHGLLAQFDATLIARAELIQSTVEEDDGHLEIEFNLTRLPEFQKAEVPVHFQIRSREGLPLITSPQFASLQMPAAPVPAAGEKTVRSFDAPDGTGYRLVELRFDAVDDLDGSFSGLHLLVVRPRGELDQQLFQLAAIVAGVAALSLVFLVPLVRRDLKKGLRPLEDFAQRTGEIDLRQLPQKISIGDAPGELVPMADKLNELLDRVHLSLLRERRFTRDVAHELRTPVAELKSLAELAGRYADQATPEAFAEVQEIAAEMEALVSALTLLNRLDAGTAVPSLSEVPVSEILTRLAARVEDRRAAGGHTLHLPAASGGLTWHTDAVLWKTAASNLLENAVTYSPSGSEITVALTAKSLSVTNPAPALTPEDVAQMKHAFWRKDAARTDQVHSGLGLALVDSIARALGLTFRIELSAEGQLACSLEQP